LFLDTLIQNRALKEGLETLHNSLEEEKLWNLYTAYSSNPFAELPSFEEWRKQVTRPTQQAGLSEQEVNTAVNDANNILRNFNPQK
jgi:hypothetical protein